MNALRRRRRFRILPFLALAIVSTQAAAAPASPIPLADAKREEAAETLLSVDMENGDAELYVGGSWKGSLIGTGGMSFGSSGAAAAASDSPLLFTQEIDLTLSAVILGHWFVEANFLDDYDLNTYRAGYMGAEGDTVRYIGIGNVGLDFPDFPYADISGGTPSSFGAYGAFGSGPLTLHALLRYDSATREEKVYVGTRERTQTDLAPAKRLKGRAFALPDKGLDAAPIVYLEDADDGTISGGDKRKYRIASASEAAVSATLGLVELSSAPAGRVAVAYGKGGDTKPWESSLGGYAGSGFLGETQAAFDESGQSIDLAAYPQPGGGAGAPAAITFNSGTISALVVYEPGAFSPFEYANRYAPPSGSASDSSAALVYSSSGSAVSGYELEESSSTSFSIAANDSGETTASTTGRYFLLTSSVSAADECAPETRFPLARIEPAAYLPGAKGTATDIALRFTSYGGSGTYDIGTDVVAGSVIVTRGGVRDPLATYDTSTGTVSLTSPAGSGEIIRISYLKNSQDRRFGSIAAGLGAVYEDESGFSARAALTLRWNVASDAFTTSSESSPGTVALSGAAAWKRENFKAQTSAAFAFEAPDTTGLYRAVGMEGDESTLGLSEDAAESAYPPESPAAPDSESADLFAAYWSVETTGPVSANAGTLAYRDFTASDILGNSSLKPITWTGSSIDSDKSGPYPVSVTELGGKTAYVAEYDLGTGKAEDGGFALWAGFQMELGSEAETLEYARTIVVPFRFYDIAGSNPVRAYVQIGSLANEAGDAESKELVWSAPLGSAIDEGAGTETSWASPSFDLSDLDRARLAGARAIRVVVRLDGSEASEPSTAAASGKLLVLPPVVQGAEFRPIVVSAGTPATAGDEVEAAARIDSSLETAFPSEISRLHPDGEAQRVLDVSWDGLPTSVEAIGVDGYPTPLPLWSYKTLSLFIRGPDPAPETGSTIRLVVAESSAALADGGSSARFIDAAIPADAFAAGAWTRVSVSYAGSDPSVSVDGVAIDGAAVAYRPSLVRTYRDATSAYGEQEGPRYFALLLEAPEGSSPADGTLAVDEICLEDPVSSFGAYAGGAVSWKRDGAILNIGKTALVSDLRLDARSELSAFGNPFGDSANAADGSSAKGGGSFSARVLGGSAAADMSAGVSSGELSWAGSHRFDMPFGPFAASERFAVDADALTLARSDSVRFTGPVNAEASASLAAQETKTVRTWKTSASSSAGKAVAASAGISAVYTSSGDDGLLGQAYQRSWIDSAAKLIPDDGSDQRKRELGADASFSLGGERLGFAASANGGTLFNATLDTRVRTAQARLSLPLKLGGTETSFSLYRTMSFTEATGVDSGSSLDDARSFGRAMSEAAGLWRTVPLWSLFSDSPADDFADPAATASAATFTDGFENSVKLPRAFGAASFFVPSSVKFTVSRTLERTLETDTDAVAAAASLQFSSMNLFGSFGSAPLFSFYKSDEFSHTFSASAEFPKHEDAAWEVGLRQSIAFYGFSAAKLSFANTTRIGTEGWSHGSALIWTIPRKTSLLKTIYRAAVNAAAGWKNGPLFAELAASDSIAEQRETVEIAASSADDLSWSWKLKHEALLNAAKKLSMSAFASLGASGGIVDGETQDTAALISVGLTLSLKF